MESNNQSHFQELGLIACVYAVLQCIYTAWIGGETPQALLEELPHWLKPSSFEDKISIITLFFFVVTITFPLVVSSAWLMMAYLDLKPGTKAQEICIAACLIIMIPFGLYYVTINRDLLFNLWSQAIGPNQHPNIFGALLAFAWTSLAFYFTTYKLPLFVTSILFGGWAGLKLSSAPKS
jgi:hypothetical protein